ncbi:Structural maintenance of chromosomes protein 5 [Gurleya vavrai]
MQIDENKKLIQMIEEEIKKINRDGDLKIYKEFEQKSRELEKFENVLDGLIKEKEIYKIDLLGLEKRKEKRKKEIVLLEEKKEEMRKKLNEIKKVDFHEVEKKSNLLIWNYLKPKNKDNNYYEADEMIKKQRKSDEFCINKNYEDLIKAELIKLCEKNKIYFEKSSDKCSTEIFYKILLENKLHEKSIFKHDERNKKEEAANFRKQYENLEHQKINITEIEKKRLESLKKVSRDAYQAVIWLRENKNMFQSEILEPSYLHIKIKNESYIEEVESLLPRNALTTFICTSSIDFDLFTKLLKDEKRLKINALLHENNYQKKNIVDQNLRNRIQSHGFDYLCIDLLEGRDEYLDLFCSIGHIHTIPISKKYLNDEDLFRNFDYRKFIIKGRYIEKRVSRYNKSDYTIINSDCKRKYVFENKNYDKDLKIIENGLKEINCKRELKNEEMKTLLCKLEDLEQSINKIYNMKAEFDTKNNEINEYENIKEKLKKNISYYENLLKKYLEDEDTREEEMIIKKN